MRMTARVLLNTTILTVSLCLLSGCVRLERSYPNKRSFLIHVSRPGEASPALTDEVLRVLAFSVSPPYEGKGFVYVTGDSMYESDFYNEFFISPSAMLTEEVRQWMAGSGLFGQVIDLSTYADPAYSLEGRVVALYGDYSVASAPKAVLEMEFFLTRGVSAAKETVLHNTYSKEMLLEGGSAQALVKGWTEALRSILLDFERHLRDRLQSP
jgi:cholesterol transport system auxiliary component